MGEPLGHREVDGQGLQVAIVDADDRCAERDRAAELGFVMRLDQGVHPETAGFGNDLCGRCVVEHRQHDQNRIGAVDSRFGDLARVNDEILGEDRGVGRAADGGEIVERSAEKGRVGEHADRIGRTAP